MMTTQEIFSLLDGFDHANGDACRQASVLAAHRLRRERLHPQDTTTNQIALLERLMAMAMNNWAIDPWHPMRTERVTPATRARGPLNAQERHLLATIPPTPSSVSRGQARSVYALLLALRVDPSPGADRGALEDAWAPIEQHLDLQHAHDEAQLAATPDLSTWPPELTEAVADALIHAGVVTDPDTSMVRADEEIVAYKQARAERRKRRLFAARNRLAELSQVSA